MQNSCLDSCPWDIWQNADECVLYTCTYIQQGASIDKQCNTHECKKIHVNKDYIFKFSKAGLSVLITWCATTLSFSLVQLGSYNKYCSFYTEQYLSLKLFP